MTNLRWTTGEVEVYQIVELEAGPLIQSIIRPATPEAIRQISWLHPYFADEAGNLRAVVQCFLIRSGGKNILIDTCVGNGKTHTDVPEWAGLHTDFLEQLAEIGVRPADVNAVACTHLHNDHVGWNTRLDGEQWVPTFPNAEYLFGRHEYEYWAQRPENQIADDRAAFDQSVSPIVEAGLARLVATDHRIDDRLRLVPSPGHTPGHVCVLIESEDQRALISGDIMHHPCQIAYTSWGCDCDTSREQAATTRQKLLGDIAGTNTLLIGSHFPSPAAGCVVPGREGFVLEF
jgi:glyoxylase-like metal-dependent hydrolase (beta-lactamase superfamily II)